MSSSFSSSSSDDDEEEKTTCRSRFGEASQRLDGLGDEREGTRGGGILGGQKLWKSMDKRLFHMLCVVLKM